MKNQSKKLRLSWSLGFTVCAILLEIVCQTFLFLSLAIMMEAPDSNLVILEQAERRALHLDILSGVFSCAGLLMALAGLILLLASGRGVWNGHRIVLILLLLTYATLFFFI